MLNSMKGVLSQFNATLNSLDRPGPHGRATDVTTLPGALRRFVSHPRPPVLLGAVASIAAVRVAKGHFRTSDLGVAAACVVAQPFVEWSVHRGVLHVRPNGPVTRACFRTFGSGHEQHHRDPANLDTMFLRAPDVVRGAAVALALASLGPPQAATAALCAGLGVVAYDWTHFLIHSGYKPRSAFYRRLRRSHQLHHFRNERHWLGVTSPVGDIVLRTNPSRDDVPVSPTAARPVRF